MHYPAINYLAVLVAAIVIFVLGGLWYSPVLFAKRWIALQNRTEEEPASGRGHAQEAQRAVREPRERFGELVHADRIRVHQKVPAAHFAVLGEVHQGAGAVVDVNR